MSTKIQWTDEVWNPVTGCSKVSPGCARCYAEGVADRFWATQYPYVACEQGDPRELLRVGRGVGVAAASFRPRQFTDVRCHKDRLGQPLRWKRPRRIFVNSMSDLFHEDVPDAFIDAVFATMAVAERHTFQVLTKRHERMLAYMTDRDRRALIAEQWWSKVGDEVDAATSPLDTWPIRNVWLGVSVENQHWADARIPLLLQVPAAVRFVSYEPALGPVNFSPYVATERAFAVAADRAADDLYCTTEEAEKAKGVYSRLDWVIVGGESGAGARPFDVAWARSVRDQCGAAGVACFIKQLGAMAVRTENNDHRYGVPLRDSHGGDWDEWPSDLRVRKFPANRLAEVTR